MTTLKLLSLLLLSGTFCFGTDIPSKKQKPIVGGQNQVSILSSTSSVPFQVLISGCTDAGGSILNKRWILTAAHIAARCGSGSQFYAGVTNRNQLGTGQNKSHKQHFSYSYNNQAWNQSDSNPSHDVGLVEVNENFSFNSDVQPVKLASDADQSLWDNNPLLNVTGFGNTSSGGTVSNELRQVSVKVNSIDNGNNKINVGGNNGNDACQGDSGGPLVANAYYPNNIQIGTVSAGGGCGNGGNYMLVSKYLDWVTYILHTKGTPDIVCGNTTFENLAVLPNNVSFSWSASPSNLFSNISSTPTSFTVSNNTDTNESGQGTVTLTVTTPSGTYTHVKQVWVGKPAPINIITDGTFTINGSSTTICRTFGYCMTSNANTILNLQSVPTATSFNYAGWPMSNSFFDPSAPPINDHACFGTNNTGSYFLTVYATNTCGTSSRNIIVQVNSCGFRVFPNPAQTTVAVEFEEPDKIESIPDVIDLIDEKTQKKVKTKDVKSLKEKEKNNPKAYKKIDFDVSDLPRGTYYLNMGFENKNGSKVEQTRIILIDK